MRYDEVNSVFKMFGKGIPAVVSTSYFDPETKIVYLGGTYRNMTAPDELCLTENEYYILERRELNVTLMTTMKKLVEMNEDSRLFLVNSGGSGVCAPGTFVDICKPFSTFLTRLFHPFTLEIAIGS